MSMCKGCGREYRKGTIAFLLTREGLKGARVCQVCAAGGAVIVAPTLAPVVKEKVVRSDGVERVLRTLRTYAAAARSGPTSEGFGHARAEGLESAIEVIKRECGGG